MAKKKNNNLFLILLVLTVLVFSMGLFFYFFNNRPLEVRVVPVYFEVGEKFGLNLTRCADLNFGRIVPGNTINRKISIKNEYDFPIGVEIFISKNIGEFILAENNFTLMEGEQINYSVNLNIPKGTELEKYEGKLVFEFNKL